MMAALDRLRILLAIWLWPKRRSRTFNIGGCRGWRYRLREGDMELSIYGG